MKSYLLSVGLVIVVTGTIGLAWTDPPIAGPAKPAPAAPKVAEPIPFKTKSGKRKGWKLVIPGGRPLATPAVVDGKVFLGGGFGSHEFYAFDATTGKKLWQYQTSDDGPTAAVVDDGHVAFNTESCELEILTVSGKPVWKKWLGDPLMSMPAIDHDEVYMAYPDSKKDHHYYLASFALKTGRENWRKPIATEVITAPVVDGGRVFAATLDGTLYSFNQKDGALVWKEKKNATSSPVIYDGRCFFSRRQARTVAKGGKKIEQQTERLAMRGTASKATIKDYLATARQADYLDYSKRAHSAEEMKKQGLDAGVGFGAGFSGGGLGALGGGLGALGGGLGGAPATLPGQLAGGKGSFKVEKAAANIAQASVAGVWAYQGSRPAVQGNRLFIALGDVVQCVDPVTEKVIWSRPMARDKKVALLDALAAPPVVVNAKVFMATARGDLICYQAKSGKVLWREALGEPITFQPAVVAGRVYVTTNNGSLYCLETGDPKDDGWRMWGRNAAHSGTLK